MRARYFLIFASISCIFAGSWDSPIKLSENAQGQSMFIDNTTKIVHIVFCERYKDTKDYNLYYQPIFLNGTTIEKKQLERVHGCNETTITGIHTGKKLYVAFVGPRFAGNIECTEVNKNGCMDVYFKESLDGGSTWTLSTPVPRKDHNDVVHRTEVRLINIEETQRIWLVYQRNDTAQEFPSLYYSQRPPKSIIFNMEEQLLQGFKRSPSVAHTNLKPGVHVVHVVWSEEREGLFITYYSKTEDNGKTWKIPVEMLKSNKHSPLVRLVSNPKNKPGHIFFFFPDNDEEKWQVKWSADQGNTWSPDSPILSYSRNFGAAMCTVKAKTVTTQLFTLAVKNTSSEFGSFVLEEGKYFKREAPFVRQENKVSAVVACMGIPAKKLIEVRAMVIGGPNGSTLYYCSQEFIP